MYAKIPVTKAYFEEQKEIISKAMEFILNKKVKEKYPSYSVDGEEVVGGTVTDLFGNEQRYDESINGAIISNGKVHNKVIEVVKKYLKDRKG